MFICRACYEDIGPFAIVSSVSRGENFPYPLDWKKINPAAYSMAVVKALPSVFTTAAFWGKRRLLLQFSHSAGLEHWKTPRNAKRRKSPPANRQLAAYRLWKKVSAEVRQTLIEPDFPPPQKNAHQNNRSQNNCSAVSPQHQPGVFLLRYYKDAVKAHLWTFHDAETEDAMRRRHRQAFWR